MIRKLRKKFILTAAGALFAVIVLVMAAVNCVFFFQTRGLLDSRLPQQLRHNAADVICGLRRGRLFIEKGPS